MVIMGGVCIMNKLNYQFDELTGEAAKLIYKTLDSVEDNSFTKADLEDALNELASLMFLITRTPEEMMVVDAARNGVNHELH
jgi:hypothetical protein